MKPARQSVPPAHAVLPSRAREQANAARPNQSGFTLLEVLVASLIMAIAVGGLLSNLSTSLRNSARLTDYDRASMIGRAKMDELLLQAKLPQNAELGGPFDPARTGWGQSGWRATVSAFDVPPQAAPNAAVLERIQLEIWWLSSGVRRTFVLDAYRRGLMRAAP
jgi:general secretion pathway protein I